MGKIDMNHNDVCDDFPVYAYPSIYLVYKSKEGIMLSERLIAENRKELFH